jgi:heme/copper-type cytochrome/quinol oxidase subunit 2
MRYRDPNSPNTVAPQQDVDGSSLSATYMICLVIAGLIGIVVTVAAIIYQLAVHRPASTSGASFSSFAITGGHFLVLVLGCVCFLTLFSQILAGFPMDRAVDKANKEAKSGNNSGQGADPLFGTGGNAGGPKSIELRTQYTSWLWLSFLICLAVPVFLLVEALVTGISWLARERPAPDIIPELDTST